MTAFQLALTAMLAISIAYLTICFLGMSKAPQELAMSPVSSTDETLSVILPIYRETCELIAQCLDSLCEQRSAALDVIVVAQMLGDEQMGLIATYRARFHSLLVMPLNGEPSEVEAYKQAMPLVRSKYVLLLNADSVIFAGALTTLYSSALGAQADVAFGLRAPRVTTRFGRFPAIDKVFRQLVLQKGRGALGMGYYIPGSFYIIRSQLLESLLQGLPATFNYDFNVSLKIYAISELRLLCLPVFLSSELERGNAIGWCFQYARWMLGKFMMGNTFWVFAKRASLLQIVGFAGVLWVWYVMPVTISVGLLVLLTHSCRTWFAIAFVVHYCFLLGVLSSLPEARSFGIPEVCVHWFVSSVVKTLAIPLMVYVRVASRGTQHHRLFQR